MLNVSQQQPDFMEDLQNFIDNGIVAYHIPTKTREFLSFFLENYYNGVEMKETFSQSDIAAVYEELEKVKLSNIYTPFLASYQSFERILWKDYCNEKTLHEILLLNIKIIADMCSYKVADIIKTEQSSSVSKIKDITPKQTCHKNPSIADVYNRKIWSIFDIQA